jgi:hypothetical protein
MSGKAGCLAEEGSRHLLLARLARNALCELRSCLWCKTAIYSAMLFRYGATTKCLYKGEGRREHQPVTI